MNIVLCLVLLSCLVRGLNCRKQEKKDAGKENKKKRLLQKVFLISLDGFRWDFDSKTKTPGFDQLKREGVTTDFVLNVFPTKTLPNHHSIVTGLYPENHGMIDNSFMDKSTGKRFHDWDSTSSWWNQSTPIWIENQMQGHDSGVIFWPGYNVKFSSKKQAANYLPNEKYAADYEHKQNKKQLSMSEQLDMALDWLSKDNVTFVALHNDEVDDKAHQFGVESPKTNKAIQHLDNFVSKLRSELKKKELEEKVNVIFVGDHGHVSTSHDREIYINDIIDVKNDVIAIFGFTNVFIYTEDNKTQKVYNKLHKASSNDTRFSVYLKKDIPNYFHIKKSSRMADILVLPQPGWVILNKHTKPPYIKGKYWSRGEHGYDFLNRDMNPGFFAYGPLFREGYKKSCIKSVDIYSLMCYILNIPPHKHDGRFERVQPFLKQFANSKEKSESFYEDDDDPVKCI